MKNKAETVILVADDVAYIRLLVHNMLANQGYGKILEATDGLETIKYAKAMKPDIIILDIFMPKVDGLSVISTITSIEPDIKMIVCSVTKDQKIFDEAMNRGAFDYIKKPINKTELLEKIEKALKSESRFSPEKESALGKRKTDFSEKIGIKLDSSKKLQKLYLYGKVYEQEFKDLEDTIYSIGTYGYWNVIIDINGVSKMSVPVQKIENLFKLIYENNGSVHIVSMKEDFKNIFQINKWKDKIKFYRLEIEAEKGVSNVK